MSILELGRILKKRWYVIVLFTLLVGAAAAAVCWGLLADKYTAITNMYVVARSNVEETDTTANMDTGKSQAIANDIVALLKTERVTNAVSSSQGLESLKGFKIEVKSSPENRIVSIEVTGKDPKQAAAVSDALAGEIAKISFEVLEVETVNILEKAKVPTEPSGPNRFLYTGVAMLCALVLIILILQIRATLNRAIPDAETAVTLTNTPAWGIMPKQAGAAKAAKKRRRGRKSRNRNKVSKYSSFETQGLENSCKTLLANIRFATAEDKAKTIVVTSASPAEGKTTVATNLALAIARGGKTVLLVEADLHYKTISQLVGIQPKEGLFAVLSGQCSAPDAIYNTAWENLYFLDAEDGIVGPTDLFSSERFRALTRVLRSNFDYVVFDTPPLEEFVDAAVIAEEADAVLFIVREGSSDSRAVQNSLAQLTAAGVTHIGLVMTFSREKSGSGYGSSKTYVVQSGDDALETQSLASRVYNDAGGIYFDRWLAGLDLEASEEISPDPNATGRFAAQPVGVVNSVDVSRVPKI